MGIFNCDDRLVAPGEIGTIKSEEQFVDVINYTYDKGTWYSIPKYDCSFLGGNRMPIFWFGDGGWMQNPHIQTKMNKFDIEIDTISLTREIEECVKFGSGILFVGPLEKLYDVKPILDDGMDSVLNNCGLLCPGMKRDGERVEKDYDGGKLKKYKPKKESGKNKYPLPLDEKAQIITRFYGLEEGNVQLLVMDGYILSFFSSLYVQLPMKEIYDFQLKPWLNANFPNHKFTGGQYSHRLLWASYSLGECEATDTIKGLFAHAGYNFNNVSLTARITTSDTTQSSLQIKIDIIADGVLIPLGKLIKFVHKGNITLEMVGEALDKSLSLVNDADKEFERLMLTPVPHPSMVVKKLLKHDTRGDLKPISSFFTAEIADLTERLDGNPGTGIDIYLAAVNAMETWRKEKHPAPQRYFEMSGYVTGYVLFNSMEEDE